MTVARDHLILFTRYPRPHRTKTRLIPALGAEGAAALQREMTRHTIRCAKQLAACSDVSVEIRFEGANATRMGDCFDDSFPLRQQGSGDLGLRMARALNDAFHAGAKRVILIGTDCPDIDAELIQQAFERLASDDLVLGPAADGGYYLIGAKCPIPELLTEIPWGSDQVLRETVARAAESTRSLSLLTTLADVDRPEDLSVWVHAQSKTNNPGLDRSISVIIPALNEADHLGAALESLKGADRLETLVVDGGSSDRTRKIAREHGCRVLQSTEGRACQMNLGARSASGEILLFLHADTRLTIGFDAAVRIALDESGVVGGAFRLRIDDTSRSLRLIEWGTDLRSRYFQMTYGDQGLFLPKTIFERLGRFPNLPIMEDFEFARRLRREGKVRVLPLQATTSARRWQALGPWRTTWRNQKMILGYLFGVSPQRLVKWYRG